MYQYLVTRLIQALVWCAQKRGRVVSYTHGGRLYMTRYAVCGWLTGDNTITIPRWLQHRHTEWLNSVWYFGRRLRACLPNLYVHQMHAPDLDPACHDHPWPWAVSWVMLGGYTEQRIIASDLKGNPYRGAGELRAVWEIFRRYGCLEPRDIHTRELKAPALNLISGKTFHRIDSITYDGIHGSGPPGTWTLFLAGPRRRAKPWGYLVPGRGYVKHSERHTEIEGKEVRHP